MQCYCDTMGALVNLVAPEQLDMMERRSKTLVDWPALISVKHGGKYRRGSGEKILFSQRKNKVQS